MEMNELEYVILGLVPATSVLQDGILLLFVIIRHSQYTVSMEKMTKVRNHPPETPKTSKKKTKIPRCIIVWK